MDFELNSSYSKNRNNTSKCEYSKSHLYVEERYKISSVSRYAHENRNRREDSQRNVCPQFSTSKNNGGKISNTSHMYPSPVALSGQKTPIQINSKTCRNSFGYSEFTNKFPLFKSRRDFPDRSNLRNISFNDFSFAYSNGNCKRSNPRVMKQILNIPNCLPQLTPIAKPNYIAELKKDLLEGLKSQPSDENNYQKLPPMHNEGQDGIESVTNINYQSNNGIFEDMNSNIRADLNNPYNQINRITNYPSYSFENRCKISKDSETFFDAVSTKKKFSRNKENVNILAHKTVKRTNKVQQEPFKKLNCKAKTPSEQIIESDNAAIMRSNANIRNSKLDLWPVTINCLRCHESNRFCAALRSIKTSDNSRHRLVPDSTINRSIYNADHNESVSLKADLRKQAPETSLDLYLKTNLFEETSKMYHENAEKECAIRVAVRIRPQNSREVIDMCRICTTLVPNEPQIILGSDKAFTFDYVFGLDATQEHLYSSCVENLVNGALQGYNATILAYGQTGSGKTFTMGSGFDNNLNENDGIIPRAMAKVFSEIEKIKSDQLLEPNTKSVEINVAAQFIELYNEDILDLLDPYNKMKYLKIQEDLNGEISVMGASIKPVHVAQDALNCLHQGALARSTAATKMNDESSRSHAVFTIFLKRQHIRYTGEADCSDCDIQTITSKLNFVDLAGSERLKRTGATGERAREGISINCGLLALGNCISALGDKSKRSTHIPYRDSKLTRLLQDSLGGNSQTLMIACVSPSDRDFMETLNTLKYANRARNIKNKVFINQDQTSRTISQLRSEIASLQMELLEYKQGKRYTDSEGNCSVSDTYQENLMLTDENKLLKQRLKSMQEAIDSLIEENSQLKVEKASHGWSSSMDTNQLVTNLIGGYLKEIETLQAKLIESDALNQQLKANTGANPLYKLNGMQKTEEPDIIINLAKHNIKKCKEEKLSRFKMHENDDSLINIDDSEDSDEEKDAELQGDLDDINSDIEIKTKLIEQLELSQQRMQVLRQHYEEKFNILNCKMKNIKDERDEVLAKINSNSVGSYNKSQIREEYEAKINGIQRELKRLQSAQREYLRQQKNMQVQEMKIQNLHSELQELKRLKARLMRQISEQVNRHREENTIRNREMAQLKKEYHQQSSAVKSLKAQINAKDQILKRKTEEVFALRRSNRKISRIKTSAGNLKISKARSLRQNWEKLNRDISNASRHKQIVMQLEHQMERLLKERESLNQSLEFSRSQQNQAAEILNDEDTIQTNLAYVQDNLRQVQQTLLQLEESENATHNIIEKIQNYIFNTNNMDDVKYLLQRMIENLIMMSHNATIIENRFVEQKTVLTDLQQKHAIQQELLYYFLTQTNAVQISELFETFNSLKSKLDLNYLNDSQGSLNSNQTYDIPCSFLETQKNLEFCSLSLLESPSVNVNSDKTRKIRKFPANPKDLLFGNDQKVQKDNPITQSAMWIDEKDSKNYSLIRVPSAPGSLK